MARSQVAAPLSEESWRLVQERRLMAELRWARQCGFFADRLPRLKGSSLALLAKVEPYEKSDIIANFGRMQIPGVPVVRQYWTSGTTGRGQEVLRLGPLDEFIVPAAHMYQFAWASLKPGEALGMTWPAAIQAGGQILRQAAEASGIQPVELGALASTAEKVRYANKTQVNGLVASPLYLPRLVSEGLSREACPSLRMLFVAGEGYPDEWKNKLLEMGLTPYEWYGITQAGPVAIQCGTPTGPRPARLHIPPHLYLVEVLDADGHQVPCGEEGRIVITALNRHASPAVRYDTGDIGRWLGWSACACGRTWPCLEGGSIHRSDDMLRIRGVNIWPSAFETVLSTVPGFVDYRGDLSVDAGGRERVQITVEIEEECTPPDNFATTLRDVTGISCEISWITARISTASFKQRRWTDRRLAYRAQEGLGGSTAAGTTVAQAPSAVGAQRNAPGSERGAPRRMTESSASDLSTWADIADRLGEASNCAGETALPASWRALAVSRQVAHRVIEDPLFVLSEPLRQWITDLWEGDLQG